MNANLKRVLALLAALVLLAAMAGCLEQPAADADVSAEPSAEAVAPTDIDYDAPAIELGDTVITVQDIADMYANYASYMEYYGMELDPATALSNAEDSCISSFVNIWQAQVQGITLNADEEAGVAEEADAHRQQILDEYIAYAQQQGAAADVDPEAQALSLIEMDLANAYGEGFTFDQYMGKYREMAEQNALSQKVQTVFNQGVSVTDDEVKAWYDAAVEEQAAAFAETPAAYEAAANDYAAGISTTPALVTPEGYVRVKLTLISPEGTLDAAHAENETKMKTLEQEYGALVLNDEDAARQAEIKTEYASLKTQNDALYEAYIVAARENAGKAQAALNAGTAFEDVMKTFGTAELTEAEIASGELLYAAEAQDAVDEELIAAIAGLADGEHTGEPVKIGDDFYLIQFVGAAPAGTLAFDECRDACAAAALADKQASEWTAVSEAWYNEALEIAVYHREAYEDIIF